MLALRVQECLCRLVKDVGPTLGHDEVLGQSLCQQSTTYLIRETGL